MKRVDTSKFETVHGKSPKGFGQWFFEVDGKSVVFTGSFGDAREFAAAQGNHVVVQP